MEKEGETKEMKGKKRKVIAQQCIHLVSQPSEFTVYFCTIS